LPIVGDAGQAVLAPAVGARAGLVVTEVVPGVSTLALVLAHRAPLAFAQVRSPLAPRDLLLPRFLKSLMFGGHGRSCSPLGFCSLASSNHDSIP
jgi:hypothetical protein